MSTLGEVRGSLVRPAFVKPADGRKGFEGKVYGSPAALPDAPSGDTPVLVCEPVEWEVEYRCHVLDGEVVAISPYLRDGDLALTGDGRWDAPWDAEAREYAGVLLDEVPLPPAIVVDIGLIKGQGWAVVEANAAWGAGVYGCDPQAVLRVLARSCAPTPSDRQWTTAPADPSRNRPRSGG
jgi:hypothetical protein